MVGIGIWNSKLFLPITIIVLILITISAQDAEAVVIGFVNNPTGNSVDWTNSVNSLVGATINNSVNFDTHPLGTLQPNFYTSIGVTLTPSGDVNTVVAGAGPGQANISSKPTSPGEGVHPASNHVFDGGSNSNLTIDFATPVGGVGLFVIDYFDLGRPLTIEAFTGPGGTGVSLGKFTSANFNFQKNKLYFMGIVSSNFDIRSVVFTDVNAASDTKGIDDIVFASGKKRGGGGPAEPPTIGLSTYGNLIVTCGVAFDGKCFTITAPFHEEFKLYEMMSGRHTISITMYCANGVNTCNYAAIGIMPYSESMDNTTWKIELYKDFEGNITPVITDPEGFLGTVTVTTQIIDDKFWIVSFTVDFKNKDTGPLKFGVQARDDRNAVRNWYLNEGVEIKDSDAYPSIVTEFENPLEIDPLCLNEDSTYRYSCAFAKIRDQAIQTAEETLWQMLNGEYIYK